MAIYITREKDKPLDEYKEAISEKIAESYRKTIMENLKKAAEEFSQKKLRVEDWVKREVSGVLRTQAWMEERWKTIHYEMLIGYGDVKRSIDSSLTLKIEVGNITISEMITDIEIRKFLYAVFDYLIEKYNI
ncbi:MAG: hypothetical protein QW734_03710 [Candidatus Bathyarchaeia archaeon]